MNKIGIEIVAALIAAVVLAVLLSLGANHYMTLRDKAAQGEARGQTLKATDGIVSDGTHADNQINQAESDVASAQAPYRLIIEEGRRNDPQTADRADRPVPDSVRRADRARRLARERSICAGSECEASSGTATAR